MSVRLLRPGDEPAIEAFLVPRLETSMFLLSNLDTAGIVDRGQTYGGTWFGAGEPLTAVAVSGWNGSVMVQGDEGLEDAVLAAVRATGRPVVVITGPDAQVERARIALGLPATRLPPELLYTLALSDLVRPPMPGVVRRPTEAELEHPIAGWRVDYLVETFGAPDTRDNVLAGLRRTERDRQFVLEVDGQLVAYSAFTAVTRGTVQIGGVWTPPALRGRGYARAVVGGSLVAAAGRGMHRSVLFTDVENLPAQRAYEALGYVRAGRFGLWIPPSG